MFQILFDKGELALRLKRQRLSVELISLPNLRRSGHGNHVIDGLFAIGSGFIEIPAQCMHTSTQCSTETGWANAPTRVTPFELAPFLF
jgi:hypothetical protein